MFLIWRSTASEKKRTIKNKFFFFFQTVVHRRFEKLTGKDLNKPYHACLYTRGTPKCNTTAIRMFTPAYYRQKIHIIQWIYYVHDCALTSPRTRSIDLLYIISEVSHIASHRVVIICVPSTLHFSSMSAFICLNLVNALRLRQHAIGNEYDWMTVRLLHVKFIKFHKIV